MKIGISLGLTAPRGRGKPPVFVSALVTEPSAGTYAFDTDPGAVRAGYVVSDGSGGYQIDTLAASGLPTSVFAGRPYVEV